MLDAAPTAEQMTALVGTSRYEIWNQLCALIEEKYDMDRLWNQGGKAWTYEYRYGIRVCFSCKFGSIMHGGAGF